MNENIKKIPYIVYEAEMYRCRKIIRLLCVILAIVLIAAIISNIHWKIVLDKAQEGKNAIGETRDFIPLEMMKDISVRKKRHKICVRTLMNTTFREANGLK